MEQIEEPIVLHVENKCSKCGKTLWGAYSICSRCQTENATNNNINPIFIRNANFETLNMILSAYFL